MLCTLTTPVKEDLLEQFNNTGLLVLNNAFDVTHAKQLLKERLNPNLFRSPITFAAQLANVSNLRARDAPPNTALAHIASDIKELGQHLSLEFNPQPYKDQLVQVLELLADSRHIYDFGGTSIAAIAGLEGELQLGGGWLDKVTSILPGTIVIARSHHLLPYRIAASATGNATGLIVSGEEILA